MKKRDIVYSVLMIVFGIFVFIYSGRYDNVISLGSGSTGGGLFPRMEAVGLVLTGVIVLIGALRRKEDEAVEKFDWLNLLITVGMLLMFYLLFKPLGFILTSALAVAMSMYRLGCRKWWVIVLYSIILPTIIFVIFYYGMYVSLPLGVLEPIIPKY